MDQLQSVSVNLLWLFQQHVIFSGTYFSSLTCLPTYQRLEHRSQSPLVLHWYADHPLSHGLWWVKERILLVSLSIIQSFQEAQFSWADGM